MSQHSTTPGGLVDALADVRIAFAKIRTPNQTFPLDFWLNMLDQQIKEARTHLADGLEDKVIAEIADCFSVGWQAIADHRPDPEGVIVHRIRTRIIPRAKELHDRDVTGNGYKVPACP